MDYEKPYDSLYYYGEGDARRAAHSRFFDKKGEGMALKSGFDAHWFCVTQPDRNNLNDVECYVPGNDDFPPCYDELVVKEQNQVLPLVERFDIESYSDFFSQMIKLYKAHSRLCRRQISQENIRWKALDGIYKIYMLLQRSELNISEKKCSDFDDTLSESRKYV